MKNKIPLLLIPTAMAMAMGAIQFVFPLCKRFAEATFSNQSGGVINVLINNIR